MARCKDCIEEGLTTTRPLLDGAPGPRCATHHRRFVRSRRLARAERDVANNYQMPPAIYNQLKEEQGGVCAICRVATGEARRLAVEHDHRKGCGHDPKKGCPLCWRGLCCKRCNELLARFSPEAMLRAIHYLANPPAQRILRGVAWIENE